MSDPSKAVFLSYASQDAEAARRFCEALRAAGVEVWFDQSELRGGDAWDQKIRRQIKECALFVPIISANTQERAEGYFRLEWHLAEQRSLLIARGRPFIVPVAIDDTPDTDALVPDAFLAVQWMRLPVRQAQGRPDESQVMEALAERIAMLLHGPQAGASHPAGHDWPTRHPLATAAAARKRPRRLLWLAGSVLGLAAAIAYILLRPSPDVIPAASASPPGLPELSETDKLVARATAILDGSALTPEQIGAANDLLAQAMEQDSSNVAAWTAAARADRMMIYPYGYDRSEERRQRAMNRATRALNLAPDSFDTRVVHTAVMAHASGNADLTREAEVTFRRLVQERPDDIPLQVNLAEVLREQQRFEEAAALFESIGEFELAAWSWHQVGQNAAAYAQVKRAVIAKRTTTALHLKALIESIWFQDLAAAQATMAGFRPSELREELVAATAIHLLFLRREPERMLQIINALSRDFMDSHAFVGPRQYWTGWAHHLAGRAERATIEWRKALPLLQTERAKAPDRVVLFNREAEIQALLGEHAEAARLLATAQRIANEAPDVVNRRNHVVHLALGHREQVLAWLTSFLRGKEGLQKADRDLYLIHAAARFDPSWDGLRGDPRFEALLRETLPEDAKPFDGAQGGPLDAQKTEDRGQKFVSPSPSLAPSPLPDVKSVAVLAFENRSSEKDSEYFSDGIGDELINVLGRIPGLLVVGRTSSYAFKSKPAPSQEIGRQLNVAYLIEGSVQHAGGKVRVIARLIRADTGQQVWGDSFEPDLKDVFAAQIDVAKAIANAFSLPLGTTPAGSRRAVDPEALQLYLQGRQLWSMRLPETLDRAEDLFKQALRLDPGLAQARSGLADVWLIRGASRADPATRLGNYSGRDSPEIGRVIAEAEAALAQDPSMAEPHATIGNALSSAWDTAGALRSLRRATELNPNYAPAHLWLGRVWLRDGRMPEGLAALERAAQLDPLSPIILDNYGMGLLFAGRPTDALPVIERALLLRPDHQQTLAWKIWALTDLGRLEEALKLAQAVELNRDEGNYDNMAFASAYALREAGETGAAEAFARKLIGYRRFIATVGSGNPAQALPFLDPPLFSNLLVHYLLFLPALDPVRSDPRFVSALATLGLTEAHARAQVWRAAKHPQKTELNK